MVLPRRIEISTYLHKIEIARVLEVGDRNCRFGNPPNFSGCQPAHRGRILLPDELGEAIPISISRRARAKEQQAETSLREVLACPFGGKTKRKAPIYGAFALYMFFLKTIVFLKKTIDICVCICISILISIKKAITMKTNLKAITGHSSRDRRSLHQRGGF